MPFRFYFIGERLLSKSMARLDPTTITTNKLKPSHVAYVGLVKIGIYSKSRKYLMTQKIISSKITNKRMRNKETNTKTKCKSASQQNGRMAPETYIHINAIYLTLNGEGQT